MTFVIKNVQNHSIRVGQATLLAGEQLEGKFLNADINAAVDRGDVTVTRSDPTAADRKAMSDIIGDGVEKVSKIIGV